VISDLVAFEIVQRARLIHSNLRFDAGRKTKSIQLKRRGDNRLDSLVYINIEIWLYVWYTTRVIGNRRHVD